MKDEPIWDKKHDVPIHTSSDEELVAALGVMIKADWVSGYRIFPDNHEVSLTAKA
jgi:hypothetical protein